MKNQYIWKKNLDVRTNFLDLVSFEIGLIVELAARRAETARSRDSVLCESTSALKTQWVCFHRHNMIYQSYICVSQHITQPTLVKTCT